MPGFLGEIGKGSTKGIFVKFNPEKLTVESIEGTNYHLERRTIKKFENDKIFHEDENYIVITEGVVLNSLMLINKYKARDFKDAILKMYEKNGERFFEEFRGSFSGLLYDRRNNRWIIYTNHFGDKQIFYMKLPDRLVFGSEFPWLVDYMQGNGIPFTLDEVGTYFLLTYAYMLEDYTLIKKIKRLPAGCILRLKMVIFKF